MQTLTEHLEHGITIDCNDGASVTCRPMTLRDAKFFIEQWNRLSSENPGDRIDARVQMATRFAECYPELAEHIGGGDMEDLLPLFFWSRTGATLRNGKAHSTGTPSTPSITPPGA